MPSIGPGTGTTIWQPYDFVPQMVGWWDLSRDDLQIWLSGNQVYRVRSLYGLDANSSDNDYQRPLRGGYIGNRSCITDNSLPTGIVVASVSPRPAACTLFWVGKTAAANSNMHYPDGDGGMNVGTEGANKPVIGKHNISIIATGPNAIPSDRPVIVCFVRVNGGRYEIWVNGVREAAGTSATTWSGTDVPYVYLMGGFGGNAAQEWGETIYLNTDLYPRDIMRFFGYLSAKWAIPLANGAAPSLAYT